MVKVRIRPHKAYKKVEIIDLHEKEIPLLINKLYDALNKQDECESCGKKEGDVYRVEIINYSKVRVYKLCDRCLKKLT